MNRRIVLLLAAVVILAAVACHSARAQQPGTTNITWKKIVLTDKFYAEGAYAGDFNKDGKMDVVYGPYWFEGPDFTKKHKIYEPSGKHEEGSFKADGEYSKDCFLGFVYDFNNDGYPDYLVYGWPGEAAKVYINPQGKDQPWEMTKVFDVIDNESPDFRDFDGDGKPEGIFHTSDAKSLPEPDKKGGCLGWASIDWSDPIKKKWTFNAITGKGGWQRYTHGYGIGDVNGDGKMDILTSKEWFENPGDNKPGQWKRHPAKFFTPGHGDGGAQIYAYDVDGDGLNDIVTSLQAHGCGLAWFKQGPKGADGEITWTRNLVMLDKYEPNEQGIKFSQLHALDLVDINGDGLKDAVTGKRYFAHNSKGDIAPLDPAVLYWFELKRNPDKTVSYIGHKVDDNSGIGVQVVALDVSGDGKPDILVGNKKGAFVFIQERK